MRIDNLRDLVKKASNDDAVYSELIIKFDLLMNERIKLVGNNLRGILNRQQKEVDKEGILESVKYINKISSNYGCDFYIDEDWDKIENFLRLTILDDISKEFYKQAK